MQSYREKDGFTMVELLVVLAIFIIAGIILASSIPQMKATWSLNSAARDVVASLNLARSHALKEGVVCAVNFTAGGYTVFRNDSGDCVTQDQIFRRVQWSDYGHGLSVSSSFPSGSIGYRPNGLTISAGGGFGGGTLTITNSDGEQRQVVVSMTGTIRIQ